MSDIKRFTVAANAIEFQVGDDPFVFRTPGAIPAGVLLSLAGWNAAEANDLYLRQVLTPESYKRLAHRAGIREFDHKGMLNLVVELVQMLGEVVADDDHPAAARAASLLARADVIVREQFAAPDEGFQSIEHPIDNATFEAIIQYLREASSGHPFESDNDSPDGSGPTSPSSTEQPPPQE